MILAVLVSLVLILTLEKCGKYWLSKVMNEFAFCWDVLYEYLFMLLYIERILLALYCMVLLIRALDRLLANQLISMLEYFLIFYLILANIVAYY